MTEPTRPIPLEYRTPQKDDRVTVGAIVTRVMLGFVGLYMLGIAITLSGVGIGCLYFAITSRRAELLVFALASGGVAFLSWIFAYGMLKYTLVGEGMFPDVAAKSKN